MLLAGLCTVDVVQRVAELPAPGEKLQATSVELAAGGPASNAAVAVAALGGRARLLTALGSHPLASVARADLEAHGVSIVDLAASGTEPPTVSAVAVRESDGERVVVSHNAEGAELDVTTVDLDGVQAVLLDGHHPALALTVAREAKARGVPVIVDAGSRRPVFDELLPMVDVCACSASFDGDTGGVPVVTRTHGAQPVRWWAGGREGEVPVPRVAARDTLGAGDVWHGALAYLIAVLGRVPGAGELPSILEEANRVAARRVRHIGARHWVRTRET
ncbi:MAG: ribokinase [Pseudonocardiaceae bacterium]|nr:ribokinase [Pseudonocardiaceae bacterium]